jgi:predicted transcriptional regulator
MAINLLDLTADIVIAHASVTEMSSDELLKELRMVYATLAELSGGHSAAGETLDGESPKRARKTPEPVEPIVEKAEEKPAVPVAPAMAIEEAFKPDQIACMVCGKSGMVTLKRHLASAHDLKPGQYRKQFNVPRDQPLAAIQYVAKMRQAALDRGLGDKLAAAREIKKAKRVNS